MDLLVLKIFTNRRVLSILTQYRANPLRIVRLLLPVVDQTEVRAGEGPSIFFRTLLICLAARNVHYNFQEKVVPGFSGITFTSSTSNTTQPYCKVNQVKLKGQTHTGFEFHSLNSE